MGLRWAWSRRRSEGDSQHGLGAARGLLNGIIFTLGLWLAIAGFVLLLLRR